MKTKLFTSVVMCVAAIATAPIASADSTISNTGPGSTNIIKSTTSTSCTLKNTNNVQVSGQNNQGASSGSATNSGNTNGGSATSGGASNSNTTNVSVTITNPGQCAATSNPVVPVVTPPASTPQVESASTRVTAVTQAAQVKAPVGGVGAGAGGADTSASAVALMAVSLAAFGYGLRRLRVAES